MFERKSQALLSCPHFLRRMVLSVALAGAVLAFGLGVGVLGYHFIAHLAWVDSFHSASMILTGMGPVLPMTDDASKIFASLYALFSGLVILSVIVITIAPVVHRVLHRFHLDEEDFKDTDSSR